MEVRRRPSARRSERDARSRDDEVPDFHRVDGASRGRAAESPHFSIAGSRQDSSVAILRTSSSPPTHSLSPPAARRTDSLAPHLHSTTLYLSPIPSSLSAPRVSKLPTPPPKYAFYIGSPASQRCRKALEAAGWKVGTMWPARRIVTNEKSFSGALGTV